MVNKKSSASKARTQKTARTKKVASKKLRSKKGQKRSMAPKLIAAIMIVVAIIIIAIILALSLPKSYTIGGRVFTKLEDYLYEVTYTDYDSAEFEQIFHEHLPPMTGACSSVRNGDFHGRSYDWYYDETAEFIIHMPATETRHASVGVAGSLPELTNNFVQTGEDSLQYGMLPLATVDGINDAGFAVNVNILMGNDTGRTTGTNPGKQDLLISNVVRYLLDNADSVDNAIELLNERNVYVSAANPKINYEFHFMLSDINRTVVVEFLDNKLVVIEDADVMTNFYLSLPQNEYSMGVERYNLLKENYNEGSTKLGMYDLMQRVRYTKSYERSTGPFWYSEYYSVETGLNKNSPITELNATIDEYVKEYDERERDGKTWQTVHFSVYDLKNKTLTLSAQENNRVFEFKI